jgi:hypothetical protein
MIPGKHGSLEGMTYWTDTIYLYSLASPFIAKGLCRLKDGTFACCVGRNVVIANKGDYASDVYNFAWSLEEEEPFAKFLTSYIGRF